MGPVEANRALYYRFVTLVSHGDLAGLDEVLSADFVDHSLPAGPLPGPEALKRSLSLAGPACPEHQIVIADLVADGDRVVGRVRRRTRTGDGGSDGSMSCGGATEETIEIVRIASGRIVERWRQPMPTETEPVSTC